MSYIKKEFIEELINSVDILDVMGQYVEFKKKGAYYYCLSPFNSEKTASCCVKPQNQRFTDFSSGKSGNVITFLMEKEHISYTAAIEKLAHIKGMEIQYEKPEIAERKKEEQKKIKSLRPYLKALNKKFKEQLQNLPETHDAVKELKKRGYNKETITEWEIGYAPGNNFIYSLFCEVGNIEAGKQLGLINDKNNDKLWKRLIYPIYDASNEIVGFASRDIQNIEGVPKWMNPIESELYHKHKILYGLNKASSAIVKEQKVWIVEGYNDVIAWQDQGILNTVGSCGTAITIQQILMIKKLCKKVILCLDGDAAGVKSILTYIPVFITNGLSVDVCILPDNTDPDDYVRKFKTEIKEKGLVNSLQPYISNGFSFLMLHYLQGDELERSNGIKELAKIIVKIDDYSLKEIYTEWLIKISGLRRVIVKNIIRTEENLLVEKTNTQNDAYEMPKGVTTPLKDLLPIIEAYQMFISNDQVFMQSTFEKPYFFKPVSNFSIEIIQHMNDDKFPKKLLKIKNILGEERIFDAPADSMTSPLEFKKLLVRQGNYKWKGDIKDLDKLTDYLYDSMGTGRMIDVLGWNPEGFFCWNNTVTVPGESNISLDKNGIFKYNGTTYYVPSANEIYASNPTKFQSQKNVVLQGASVSMEDYMTQMIKVHRGHAITGILFAFASAFQDIVVKQINAFPLLLLWGPPSTGKDQLIYCLKSFFGNPQTAISLENQLSTGKAQIREFAQFGNMISHLSEYKNGDKQINGMLKGLWDRHGYKRGTIDSNVSTDTIPILSSTVITGNEYPNDDAIITRALWEEVTKEDFNEKEKQEYEKLDDMTKGGVSVFMQNVIWHRKSVENFFTEKYRMYSSMLSKREMMQGMKARVITNLSVIGAIYEILKEKIIFPFSFPELLEHFDEMVSNQRKRLESSSVITKWWDVFIAVMRGNIQTQIRVSRDLKIEGERLYFNFTNVYNRIQTEWWQRYSEVIPAKGMMLQKLKEDNSFIESVKSVRMSGSATAPNTSALVINVNELDIKEDLLYAVEWQKNEGTLFNESPATPDKGKEERDKGDQLPF